MPNTLLEGQASVRLLGIYLNAPREEVENGPLPVVLEQISPRAARLHFAGKVEGPENVTHIEVCGEGGQRFSGEFVQGEALDKEGWSGWLTFKLDEVGSV
ncbi:hypothetical protein ACOXVJ_04660 [Pseudomonas knackmussii]|uniref:hypothetical protein n=1 Tax=Pseudomonas knackmussii TaxID=65741 RepID=UPI003BE438DD